MERALDLVLMIDNHDTQRFTNEPGAGVPEDEIRRREMLALDLIFTLPGIPQLYYGDEVGLYGGPDPDNRRDMPSWASDPVARAQPHPGVAVAGSDRIFTRVARLAQLRTTTPALISGAYRELWRQNGAAHPNVLAFARGTGTEARIVVVSNGAAPSGPMHIPVPAAVLPSGTTLMDELGDGAPATTTITGGQLTVNLPGKSAAIYRVAP
jgi:glycosidase